MDIGGHGKMGFFSQDIIDKAGEVAFGANLNKKTYTRVIHRFNGFLKPNLLGPLPYS